MITGIIIPLLITQDSYAQLSYFEAEGKSFFEVIGAVPQSEVEFYSATGGGRLLRKDFVDESGKLVFQADKSFKPAFVLNRSNDQSARIKGNGLVHFLGAKEFSFQNLVVNCRAKKITISWYAAAHSMEDISFRILKSIDGATFNTVSEMHAHSESIAPYIFFDEMVNENVSFRIDIVSASKGKRYSTGVLIPATNAMQAFPTCATSFINLQIPLRMVGMEYKILNESGQVVIHGKFSKQTELISIAELAVGPYIISATNTNESSNCRFIKL